MPARKKPGFFRVVADRLERSQHVFLLGLVVAFAVEILVDWNSTFYEINVLRAQLGEKATHYATILRVALSDAALAGDKARAGALIARVLEDPEVLHVRVSDGTGALVAEAGAPLGERYPHQLARDIGGMLADPDALRRKIAASRHRDVFQVITDAEDRALRAVLPAGLTAPAPPSGSAAALALQDRLYDERDGDRREDRSTLWALGLIDRAGTGEHAGVVLVALRTDGLRAGIRKKLWKGLAITLVFLAIILVQQVSARRAKLRFFSLQDTLKAARDALAAMLKGPPPIAGIECGFAFTQAERLGGTVFDFRSPAPSVLDVFVGLPEGSGVDVAFASIHLLGAWRRMRAQPAGERPEAWLARVAAEYAAAPIGRRLSLGLLRFDATTGELQGAVVGMEPPLLLDAARAPIAPAVEELDLAGGGDERGRRLFTPPIRRFSAVVPAGGWLVLHDDGLAPGDAHPLSRDEVQSRAQEPRDEAPQAVAAALEALTVERAGTLQDDLFVLVARRAA